MQSTKHSEVMLLRPHHILDIINGHGHNVEYKAHPYGHSQHIVANRILSDLDTRIRLVVGADAICYGCKHLLPDGRCDDVVSQLEPSPSKQAYNDVLDGRLLDYLHIRRNAVMTVRGYLEIVDKKVPGIESICTHPKENSHERLRGLRRGLTVVGIRAEL